MGKMECQRASGKQNVLKGRAAIVAGGVLSKTLLPKSLLSRYEYVVACDGGGVYLWNVGFVPDLLVGDFDSVNPEILRSMKENGKTEVIAFPPEKNFTDLELGVELAIQRGYRFVDLYGVTGSRLDHTFGSAMLLYRIRSLGGVGTIFDEHNIIFAGETAVEISGKWIDFVFRRKAAGVRWDENGISGTLEEGCVSLIQPEMDGEPGRFYISLLLLTDCKGITLEGFQYPLTDYNGSFGPSLCISNELAEEKGRIQFEEGRMLVIISRD